MASPVAHPRSDSDSDDADLARRAAAGDGRAFAALYDRHERRVYGFCLRMLGSPHDAADATQETFVRVLARLPSLAGRELNFVAYVLAAARNACYDAIEARRRSDPLAEDGDGGGEAVPRDADLSRDPERSAMLASAREQVRAANAQLPPRQREVLALREVEQLSYEEIGALMGLNRNAVAQLVSRARIGLRALVRTGALASISPAAPECERALPLLASLQDDEAPGEGLGWLSEHLAACETCRLSQAAMQEAGASYRLLAPVVPLAWLRHATIARAADYLGADWSAVAGPDPVRSGARADGGTRERGDELAGAGRRGLSSAGERRRGRSRRSAPIAAGAMLLACLLLVALVGATRDGRVLAPAARVTGSAAPPARRLRPATRATVRRADARDRAASTGSGTGSGALAPTAGVPVSSAAAPQLSRGPAAAHRRARHSPSPRGRPKPPVAPEPKPSPPTRTTQTTPPPPPVVTPPPSATPTATTPAPPSTTTTTPPPPPTEPREQPPGGPAPPGFVP